MNQPVGRITHRRPGRRQVVAPERHPDTGRYAVAIGHGDKERQGPTSRRPSTTPRIVAGVLGAAAIIVLVVVLLARNRHDGASTATTPTTTVTSLPAATAATPSITRAMTTTAVVTTVPATTTSTTTTTTPATTTTPTTTVAGPTTLAEALFGRYDVMSTVLSDSLAPARAGSTQPWQPFQLTVDCGSDPCTVLDATWGAGTLTDETITFTIASQADCLGKARTMDLLIVLTPGERDALGFVQTLVGTATFHWGSAGQCPAFVEEYSLAATRV